MENRIQRATRIVNIMQFEDSGHWTPCDHKGNPQDQETAEYVKHVTTGKVYKWNQQKRIAEHENREPVHKTDNTSSDTVELSQLIDRMFEIVDRLERVNQKVG